MLTYIFPQKPIHYHPTILFPRILFIPLKNRGKMMFFPVSSLEKRRSLPGIGVCVIDCVLLISMNLDLRLDSRVFLCFGTGETNGAARWMEGGDLWRVNEGCSILFFRKVICRRSAVGGNDSLFKGPLFREPSRQQRDTALALCLKEVGFDSWGCNRNLIGFKKNNFT